MVEKYHVESWLGASTILTSPLVIIIIIHSFPMRRCKQLQGLRWLHSRYFVVQCLSYFSPLFKMANLNHVLHLWGSFDAHAVVCMLVIQPVHVHVP